MKTNLSFFAWLRQRLFRHRVDHEIFQRVFPHLEREADFKYPFTTDAELVSEVEALKLHSLLAEVESHIEQMPRAYGQAFRYLLHRDLHQRLVQYARLAQRRIPQECRVPRFAHGCA